MQSIIDRESLVERIVTDDKLTLAYAAERCKDSLKYLCTQFLRFTEWDQCHDELEIFLNTSTKNKKIILIPRGHLKSSIVTIGWSIQQLLKNPDIKILLANAVWDNARSFLSEIKEYLTNKSFLPKLFGQFQSDTWTQEIITIKQRKGANKTPTITTAGVDKALASQHYDLIVCDDLVNRQNVTNAEQISKIKKFYSDALDLLEPNGVLVVVGTRYVDGELYGAILDTKGKQLEQFDVYIKGATKDGTIDGEVIFPKKFSTKKLYEIRDGKGIEEEGMGSFEFYAQYFNQCISMDTQHFKMPVRYWNELGDGSIHYGAFDPATSEKKDACDAVVIDGAITRSNQLLAVEYKAFHKKDPTEMINKIFEYASKFQWKKLLIETNGGQEVYVKLVQEEQRKRNVFFEVVPVHHTKDKFSRIIALQPRWESGNLLLKQGMAELEDQMLRFPVATKNDIVDALAMIQEVAEPQYETKSRAYYPDKHRRAA